MPTDHSDKRAGIGLGDGTYIVASGYLVQLFSVSETAFPQVS